MIHSAHAQSESRVPSFAAAIAFGLVACFVYGVGAGLRGDIGILLEPLAAHTGLTYGDVSFCIAVMQLIFGAMQPAFGMVAAKRSNRSVLLLGVAFLLISLAGIYLSHSFVCLLFSLGVLFGVGAGALAFDLILASSMRFVGRKWAMMISGMLNAAAGLGSFALSPAMQALLDASGLGGTLASLAFPIALLFPAVLLVTSRDPSKSGGKENDEVEESGLERGDVEAQVSPLRAATHDRVLWLLLAGFSTCGFHMVIIESHLFSQFVFSGIDTTTASWVFSLYGISTIFGALLSGYLSTRVKKGGLLAFYYGFRAVWVVLYIFVMPKSVAAAILFSVGLGLTGDATVSPTAGIVNARYSLSDAATLMGALFFGHQIGGFLSAWLGGVLLEATSGYNALWMIDIMLCVLASVASARILIDRKCGFLCERGK